MSKHVELAKKLKALADKGIGGEKTNAQKMLSALLKKHKLTLKDIEEEKKSLHYFKITSDKAQLLHQIIGFVNHDLRFWGEIPAATIKKLKMKGNFFTECTVAEFIQIEAMFEFYSRLYESELNVFFHAFVAANSLYPSIPNDQKKNFSDLTKEEQEAYIRAQELAEKIKTETFRKQIK